MLDGKVDELALYKRVLTANERTWLYNLGHGKSYADMGVQYHAVIGAVTNGVCPQGEVCDYEQATPLPSPQMRRIRDEGGQDRRIWGETRVTRAPGMRAGLPDG